MSKQKQEKLFWGIILLIIGVLFMLDRLGININVWHFFGTYWPVILIAIGAKNIWYHFKSQNKNENNQEETM